MTPNTPSSLTALFNPSSIALIGASTNPNKIAGKPLHYLRTSGFEGDVYPVNPASTIVQDLRAYPTIAAIGKPIDLAVLSIPGGAIEDSLDACGRAGVGAAIVFASGFAEIGDEGALSQQAIHAAARRYGIRLLGPNCLGMMNVHTSAYATFTPLLESGGLKAGNIAVISGSGAFGVFALARARARGIGISQFASTGNEADVDLADCIDYLVDDPNTKVIACYMEGARDGGKLARALERARLNRKPVVVCKSGSSQIGSAKAASHTAALAGADGVFDGVFRQFGAYRAADLDELFDVAYACSIAPLPRSRKLGILSMSGGAAVSMADAAETFAMEVPDLPATVQQRILERAPHASVIGPIDLTGKALDDRTLFRDAIDWATESGSFDSIVAFQAVTGITEEHRPFVTETWSAVRMRHPDLPVATVSVFDDQNRTFLDGIGCLAFEEPTRAMRALASLAWFAEAFAKAPAEEYCREDMPVALPGALSEHESLAMLERAGIPVIPNATANTAESAATAAVQLGLPVAVKILSRDIPHKSDIGGVALKLRTQEEVRDAFATVMERAATARPDAKIDGVLVAPMVSGGVECILGGLIDPVFGPTVMFGLGGIHVEVLKDVTFRMAPVDEAQALDMVKGIRSASVLHGVRGQKPVDQQALARVLVRLSRLMIANRETLQSIEINPFVALPDGGFAVDALVIPQAAG